MVLLAEAGHADLDLVSSHVPSQGFLTPEVTRRALIRRTDGIIARRTIEVGPILMEKEGRRQSCVCGQLSRPAEDCEDIRLSRKVVRDLSRRIRNVVIVPPRGEDGTKLVIRRGVEYEGAERGVAIVGIVNDLPDRRLTPRI